MTDCGSFRNATTLSTASALQQFSRDVYLSDEPEPAPVLVSAEIPDSDGDAWSIRRTSARTR